MECPTCGAAAEGSQQFCRACGGTLDDGPAGGGVAHDQVPAQAPSADPTPAPGPTQAPGPAPAPAPAQAPAQTLTTIGDIVVTSREVITPTGTRPIGEVSWAFQDMSTTSQAIPTWAIVCCIIFALACLLGLLFLLVKEERTTGRVQVTVQGPSFVHVCQLPVGSRQMVDAINAQVNYARSVSVNYGGAS